MNCKTTLKPIDLIPVVSFLLLHGKCRYCGKPISSSCLWIEIFTAAVFLLVGYFTGFSNLPLLLYRLFFALIFIFIAVYDFFYQEIPDRISLPAIAIALLFAFYSFTPNFSQALIGFAVGSIPFFLLFLFSNGKWMGGGDARLGGLLGILLGWQHLLLAIFFAAALGSGVGLILILQNKRNLTSKIPFGPYLAIGGMVMLLWGNPIWNWYAANFFF